MGNLRQSALGSSECSSTQRSYAAAAEVAGMSSRDNHNGNARGGRPNYYLWKPWPRTSDDAQRLEV